MILQPTMERMPKQEIVDETIEVRPTKRRKSTPPPEINKLSNPENYVNGSAKDERKKKWLAGLSHEELLGVAHGAVWQGKCHVTHLLVVPSDSELIERSE